MGRYRQERIIIKRCTEMDLVFMDWNRIYAYIRATKRWYLFHKFHSPLGTYTNSWRPFKSHLLRLKDPSFLHVCRLANEYDVLSMSSVGRLDFSKKNVEIRYSHWTIRGIAK